MPLATPATIAFAGFAFDPIPQLPDRVVCPFCNVQKGAWSPEEDPMSVHIRLSPTCSFVVSMRERKEVISWLYRFYSYQADPSVFQRVVEEEAKVMELEMLCIGMRSKLVQYKKQLEEEDSLRSQFERKMQVAMQRE
jgi:hypothetical protein